MKLNTFNIWLQVACYKSNTDNKLTCCFDVLLVWTGLYADYATKRRWRCDYLGTIGLLVKQLDVNGGIMNRQQYNGLIKRLL